MKTSIDFFPRKASERKTWPSKLNSSLVQSEEGSLVIPNVGDIVIFNNGESEKPQLRKVVRRTIEYSSDHVHVACETDPEDDHTILAPSE